MAVAVIVAASAVAAVAFNFLAGRIYKRYGESVANKALILRKLCSNYFELIAHYELRII